MARGTKKESLTPEERLQAALVPESEQPYPVPENWCWVRLGLLLQSSKEKTEEFSDANLKYVGLEHMQKDGGIVAYDSAERVKSLKNVFHPQQILYGKLRPYLNKHDIATFDGVCSTDILVFNIVLATTPKFINFFLDQDTFIEYAISNSKGINLPRVSESVVLNAKCPLPPFAEQQRIVERIESLFVKLDEAKQKAQDALDSFETRKAAILHKAFAGELTAQWRKEHGLEVAAWIEEKLKNCITLLSGQDFSPDKYNSEEKGIPYITGASNFENSHVCINRWTEKPSVIAQKGDILLVCKGSGYGKTVIADFEYAHIARQIMSLRVTAQLSNQFLLYYLQNNIRYIRESGQGLIPGISRKIVLDMEILLPSINEQFEIIRILDGLFAEEQQAKEAAEGVLEQIDLIKKAILARAFRGELGTNDPSEESAVELLKQVL